MVTEILSLRAAHGVVVDSARAHPVGSVLVEAMFLHLLALDFQELLAGALRHDQAIAGAGPLAFCCLGGPTCYPCEGS